MDSERAEAAQLAGVAVEDRAAQRELAAAAGVAGVAGVADAAGPAGLAAAGSASRAWANAISWPAAAQGVSVASDAVTVSQRSSSGADAVASISACGKPAVAASPGSTFGISRPPAATGTPPSSTVQPNR